MCPKLMRKHIFPNNFEKMRVYLATQALSHSTAVGINSCLKLNLFNKKTTTLAKSTSLFVEKFYNIFDCLNSREMTNKTKYKNNLSENNFVYNYLKDSIAYLKTVKLENGSKKVNCFKGLIQTINALLQLSEDVKNDGSAKFILTSRENQDPLENCLAQVRAKGGNSKNPSIFEFHYILARLMSGKLILSSSKTNCVSDDDLMLSNWYPDNCENPVSPLVEKETIKS